MAENEVRPRRRTGRLRPPWRATALGVAAALAAGGLSLTAAAPAAAVEIGSEPFTGERVKDESLWFAGPYLKGDPTGWACLTAASMNPVDKGDGEAGTGGPVGDATVAPLRGCQTHEGMPTTPDKPGEGALRLTSNKKLQNGYVMTTRTFDSRAGLRWTVDFAMYNPATANPADGLALMIMDGNKPLPDHAGKNGAGLGYSKLPGGYLGIGLDVYGNYTTDWMPDYHTGGSAERKPNSITIRGAEKDAAGKALNNPFVATYQSGRRFAVSEAKTREEAKRTAVVELSHEGVMRVQIDFHDGTPLREVIPPVDLDTIEGQPPVPDKLRIGFSASTGASTQIHEIWNGKVETLDPNLFTKVEPDGTVKAGEPAKFTMTTTNDKLAGPTTGPITTTQTFPAGIVPKTASGDGWDCKVEGQKVTCTRPGPVLQAGQSAPPVTVTTDVAPTVKGEQAIVSDATTPNDMNTKPDTNKVDVIPAKGPDLTVTTKPRGEVQAGEPAEYQIDVTNKPEAGATRPEDTIAVVRNFPEGIKPVSAAGDGWECKVDGQNVNCTRPGDQPVIKPGESAPPIIVKTEVADDAAGELTGITVVATPDTPNPTPVKDTTTVKPAIKDPNLTVVTKPDGDVVAGKPANFVIAVADAPDAGPTTGPTTVVRTFPEGIKPVTATGDGWDCKIEGQKVTCTHPDLLQPGEQFPPIHVATEVDKGAKGDLTGTTGATTPGAEPKAPVKDTVSVIPASTKEPDLSTVTKPEGEVVAGKPATFLIDVSNAEDAGPTHDTVTVTQTFPEGVIPRSANGLGWECKLAGQTVTCTRPGTGLDALQPGSQYPPIKVTTEVEAGAEGTKEGETGVVTPGDKTTDPVKHTFEIAPNDGAGGPGVNCYGGLASLSLKPGLTMGDKLQTFTGSGTSAGCKSLDAKRTPAYVEVNFEGSGKGSCLPSLGLPNAEMTGTMTWSINGRTVQSTVTGTSKLTLSGANFDGVVTAGQYKGMKVHATADWDIASNLVTAVPACFLGGYTDATGTWNSVSVG